MVVETSNKLLRVRGKLKELIIIRDDKGNILQKMMKPVMVELYNRDIIQIVIGSCILALPVAYTEEVWNLGRTLPMINILLVLFISLLFISFFIYFNFYKGVFKGYQFDFIKRVLATYFISFFVVTFLLLLFEMAPWISDPILAFKRSVLVTFPASLSATVADMIK